MYYAASVKSITYTKRALEANDISILSLPLEISFRCLTLVEFFQISWWLYQQRGDPARENVHARDERCRLWARNVCQRDMRVPTVHPIDNR